MSNAAQLTINWSTPIEIQNTTDIIGVVLGDFQKDNTFLSPLSIAKYFLYNRQIGKSQNFGWENNNYLSYDGGFITCGDKVNTKYSDFTLNKQLTVVGNSFFNQGMDLIDVNKSRTNTINNLKSLSKEEFFSGVYDNYVVSKKDYVKQTKYKGMITMWSGTYDDLVKQLPAWRLCAPPDSNKSENGITIPNLQGRFVLAATYQEYGAFQPKDNLNVNFGFSIAIDNSQNIGGTYNHTLTIGETPRHRHENVITLAGGQATIVGQPQSFMTAVGGVGVKKVNNHSGGVWNTTLSVWLDTAQTTRFGISTTDVKITQLSQDPIGGNNTLSEFPKDADGPYSLEHTNMPPYYALAYIIYVETPRG